MDKYFGNDLLGIMRDRNALNLSQTTNFRLFQTDDNFKFDENGRKFSNRVKKTLWEKEKLLATSNFSFSHSVSKDL